MSRTIRSSPFVTVAALALLLPAGLHAQANATMTFESVTGGTGGTIEIPVVLSFGGSVECAGYSFGACADPAVVASIAVTDSTSVNTTLFFQVNLLDAGWTVGAVFDHDSFGGLDPGSHEVCRLVGAVTTPTPAATPISDCHIGDPLPVDTVMVFAGTSFVPTVVPGTITIVTGFRRGDTNGDGLLNIADAITLWGMFSPITAAPITCDDAADANDDGQVDVADVVTILAYLFQGGSIPAPLLECGPDETPDALDCVEAGGC